MQTGEGKLWDATVGRLLERQPKHVKRFLKEYGDYRIVRIDICRKPIVKVISEIANIFTLGTFNKTLEKLNYDDVYHLYSVVHFDNGETYLIEKNERVIIKPFDKHESGTSCRIINSLPALKLNDLFSNKSIVYRYSAHRFNCQRFLLQLYKPILSEDDEDFILQDAGELLKEGPLRELAQYLTDTAGVFDTVIKGGGYDTSDHYLRGFTKYY